MRKSKKPLRIMDTTLRDGHQSLFATRMRFEDMVPLLEKMDAIGFEAMEVWGGATFDVCHRFLNEDPWQRLADFKKHLKKTPLQMLLRGQNLVGYRNYPDDVVEAFVEQAAESGMDRFRVFDALNDERNFETSFKAIKKTKKHIQGTVCYSLTERRLGGPIYNIKYFVAKAKTLSDMGADSLCIKDMAGILSPYDAFELITALKEAVKIPLQLHTHYTSGMASMTCLKASEAGIDVIDTAFAPFALRSSQPAVEPIVVALEGTDRDTGLNLDKLLEIGEDIEKIAPNYIKYLDSTKVSVIDTAVLKHQVPGGMLSNMIGQLKEAGALDKIGEVYKELPKVRKELGSPPLVTPSSQIVGIQAVQNVLFGRYKMISSQVKDLCYGLYGKTPAPIDPKVRKLCLKDYERGEKPITKRPADILKPELDAAKETSKDYAKDIKDVLVCALFPTTGEKFLKTKYGLECELVEAKPKAALEEKKSAKIETTGSIPPKSAAAKTFNVYVGNEYYRVDVDLAGGNPVISSVTTVAAKTPPAPSVSPAPPAPSAPSASSQSQKAAAKTSAKRVSEDETALNSPMNGLIISVRVREGDKVKTGDVLIELEAMKMINQIKSPRDGSIKSVQCKKGENVEKDQTLIVIG